MNNVKYLIISIISKKNLLENIIYPIISNILSPILLFLIASICMKSNFISKFIAKIYQTVKEGLELNTDDEIPRAPKTKEESDAKQLVIVSKPKDSDRILKKISKNYGSDDAMGWKVRTFYTLFKSQLKENEIIQFKVRGFSDIVVNLRSEELIRYFNLDDPKENISDGSGRIRIYIFQDKNDVLYLTRFGKNYLNNPIILKA